jgi:hypothetical protein
MTEAQPTVDGPTYQDILELARNIQKDITTINAQLTTITRWLADQAANEPTQPRNNTCPHPHCRISFLTKTRLDDHLTNVHGTLETSGTPS